jgi:hypothetical protein
MADSAGCSRHRSYKSKAYAIACRTPGLQLDPRSRIGVLYYDQRRVKVIPPEFCDWLLDPKTGD